MRPRLPTSAHLTSSVTVVGHLLVLLQALLSLSLLRYTFPSESLRRIRLSLLKGMVFLGSETQAFADFIDSRLPSRVSHVKNKNDFAFSYYFFVIVIDFN
ncbi:hypothetical protein D9757_011590 [Collybiopsis confluens]|uniref:Uncharacterized protein n=1 Tax=Collybiopsis confluens TaxID=2823264 RepID=A0A8H5G383_9AGAR|nr:hypothetical protein D9757_011590 [Collybiopsis confluens]